MSENKIEELVTMRIGGGIFLALGLLVNRLGRVMLHRTGIETIHSAFFVALVVIVHS